MGFIQQPEEITNHHEVDGNVGSCDRGDRVDRGRATEASGPIIRDRLGLLAGRDGWVEQGRIGRIAKWRQSRFAAHPWKEGEMAQAIASFTGEVIKCPTGWADGIAPEYIKRRPTK